MELLRSIGHEAGAGVEGQPRVVRREDPGRDLVAVLLLRRVNGGAEQFSTDPEPPTIGSTQSAASSQVAGPASSSRLARTIEEKPTTTPSDCATIVDDASSASHPSQSRSRCTTERASNTSSATIPL
jgi:hypothetical protein